MGSIVIERPWRYMYAARSFMVWIDDRKFGPIKPGKTQEFYIEPGRHEIWIQVDWSKTSPMSVDVNADRQTVLICGPAPWSDMLSLKFWFSPSAWIYLKHKD